MSIDADTGFRVEAFDAVPHPHALAGVLFAEEFDLADAGVAMARPPHVSPAPPPASYSAADLEQARELGFETGRSGALADLHTATRAAEATACDALRQALETSEHDARTVARAYCEATATAIVQSLAAALPALCTRYGAAEAAALTEALMPMLAHQPSVSIRANPHTLPTLSTVLASHLAEPGGRVRLIGTDALGAGDVTIEWPDGSARRDAATFSRALSDALSPLGLSFDTPPTASMHATKELAHAG